MWTGLDNSSPGRREFRERSVAILVGCRECPQTRKPLRCGGLIGRARLFTRSEADMKMKMFRLREERTRPRVYYRDSKFANALTHARWWCIESDGLRGLVRRASQEVPAALWMFSLEGAKPVPIGFDTRVEQTIPASLFIFSLGIVIEQGVILLPSDSNLKSTRRTPY